MRNIFLLGSSVIALFVGACGGDLSPREACEEAASALCSRFYACYTAEERAAGMLPATEAECVATFQADCAMETEATACEMNETYDGGAAAECVDQIGGLTCAQVRDQAAVAAATSACDRVCVPAGA